MQTNFQVFIMLKLKSYLLVFACVSMLGFGSFAQDTKTDLIDAAYHAFGLNEYAEAYPLFDQLAAKYPNEVDFKFRLGQICLHYPLKKERAIDLFLEIIDKIEHHDGELYLGKAYHQNYKFEEAAKHLQKFIDDKGTTKNKEDLKNIAEAKHIIDNCQHGKFLLDNRIIADIKNIGSPVNTEELEGVPIITTDESMIIFTYCGKNSMGGKMNEQLRSDEKDGHYGEDIMMSIQETDSTFGPPIALESLNTLGNDAAVAISPDGMTLFTYASNNDLGDIYVSHLKGFEWTKPERLNKNINTDAWEGSCSISADGRYLYFASERIGGFGQRDLYVSENKDGEWGPAVNLGPKINTEYNDDSPFIHPDGITLFFSSEGHSSIGGYDIMFTVKRDNDWTTPKNMGMPLNTTEDDRFYVINSRGDKGFFSSDRAGGKGSQDLYVVTPGVLGDKPVIALLKGTVYGNDKPIEGKIEVVKIVQKETIGPFTSNNKTGKYLMALSPGYIYRIKVNAEGFDPVEEDLDIENLDKYMEVNKDFYLYSAGYTPTAVPTVTTQTVTAPTKTVATTPTIAVTPTVAPTEMVAVTTKTKTTKTVPTETAEPVSSPCSSTGLPDLAPIKGKSLNDPVTYQTMLELAGDYCLEGLIFKVQIAAYRHPKNYKYGHLAQYGKPEIVDYPDGITRFTQKEFKTVRAAEVHRQKAIGKGQKDAWIVGFVNGKRYTLEELINLDFLGRSIN
jgi:tetratricopeptide (TPR) repeat protein